MAKTPRGEVELKSASGTVYTLRLGFGAICQLEDALNLEADEILEKWKGRFRARLLRDFIKVAAVDPPAPSNEEASALIDAVGIVAAVGAVSECISLAFQDFMEEEPGTNGASASPPKPPADTKRARRAAGAGISTAAPS